MRALVFTAYGPPDVLHLAEVPAPHPGPGRIRIAVRASGVSPGETLIRSGALRDTVRVTFPYRTGFDAAGVVDELGAGVTGVRVGDEVFGMTDPAARGANADHAVLAHWAPKPPAWDWAEAGGAAGAVETATRVLDRLAVGAGHTLLVNGAAGGVGTVAVQLAAARGAAVLGTASTGNHDFLRGLGAVPTTYGAGLVERVRALAPGGVHAVFDCAGGALPDLVALAGGAARVVTIAPDRTAPGHDVHLSHAAPAAGGGPAAGGRGPAVGGGGPDPLAVHGLADAVALASGGRLRIPVAATFPLASAPSAHALSEGRHARGKIVLLH